jgi:acetyltransferase
MAFDQEKARKLIAGAPAQEFVPESDSKEILTAYGLPVIRTEIARPRRKPRGSAGKWDTRWS